MVRLNVTGQSTRRRSSATLSHHPQNPPPYPETAIRSHIVRYLALEPDQQFAIAWAKHNTTAENLAFFSRNRRSDYTAANQFFFQWWNYIVYDSETHNHYNFAYQVRFFFKKNVSKNTPRLP
jgi:hypothetical protein